MEAVKKDEKVISITEVEIPKPKASFEFIRYEVRTAAEFKWFTEVIWPTLINGIDTIVEVSKGDLSRGIVFREIVNNQSQLWLGFIDGKYIGFATTGVNNLDGESYLTIKQVYIKKGHGLEAILKGQKKLFEFGKKKGCTKVRMVTSILIERRALKRLGWKPTYQEYEISLKEKNSYG